MTALRYEVVLYQLDHLSARFRHEPPTAAQIPEHLELRPADKSGREGLPPFEDHLRVGIDLPLLDWTRLGKASKLTITLDIAPLVSAQQQYRVGDPDPTPDRPDGTPCGERLRDEVGGTAHCTWERGHDGAHVAGDGISIVAWWEQ